MVENNNGNASSWTARDVSSQADGPQEVFAADVDGDGDIDIVSASKNDRIAWHENDGASAFFFGIQLIIPLIMVMALKRSMLQMSTMTVIWMWLLDL